VSYGEVLEHKYIRVTVLYVVVCFVMWLYYCYVIFIIMLRVLCYLKYSYCYVCSILCHCVVFRTVCV
jgi:hypothetical protein